MIIYVNYLTSLNGSVFVQEIHTKTTTPTTKITPQETQVLRLCNQYLKGRYATFSSLKEMQKKIQTKLQKTLKIDFVNYEKCTISTRFKRYV